MNGLLVRVMLEGKKILIVGGGRVALRKAKRFLEERAEILVVAKQFCEEFSRYRSIPCMEAEFSEEMLGQDIFLVYAATDDPKLNQKILKEAGKRKILCGSAQALKEADFFSMAERKNELFELAFSSAGTAVGLDCEIVEQAEREIWNRYGEKLRALLNLREKYGDDLYRNIRKDLCAMSLRQLRKLYELPQRIRCYVFHGTCIREETEALEQFFRAEEGEVFACLKSYDSDVFLMETLFPILSDLQNAFCNVEIIPVFLSKNRLWKKVTDQAEQFGLSVREVLFEAYERRFIQECIQRNPGMHCIFLTHEAMESFSEACRKAGAETMTIKENPERFKAEKNLCLIPVFVLEGMHSRRDTEQIAQKIKAEVDLVSVWRFLLANRSEYSKM